MNLCPAVTRRPHVRLLWVIYMLVLVIMSGAVMQTVGHNENQNIEEKHVYYHHNLVTIYTQKNHFPTARRFLSSRGCAHRGVTKKGIVMTRLIW
tara:strand:- start:488 stop:769 length:282 start_codon:yes stop_codon:yes gene_type:complete